MHIIAVTPTSFSGEEDMWCGERYMVVMQTWTCSYMRGFFAKMLPIQSSILVVLRGVVCVFLFRVYL